MLSAITRGTLLRLGLCVVVALSVSSCDPDVPLSSISESDAVGTWKGSDGAVVELHADRKFTTSGIDWRDVSKGSECPQGETASGKWAFWGSEPGRPDSSEVLDEYTSGDTIHLAFVGPPQGGCLINLSATKGGSVLCVSDDFEIPCAREITFTKESVKTES
ncbi:hypothetical protein [Streptomyces sp. WAC01280]|uniref:hypothetical protein n=1 Tax=Streptomyces sp. WAC01280 TaxID=2487424 RepID=UPI000F78ABBF|nr:hypothetical protein [Streptomyces sp. WAC01280]RSS50929.1 hypothetical protein EF909_36500 [Streptomyces sp. WAC01280]